MVEKEVLGRSIHLVRFRTAIERKRLKVRAPRKKFLDKAREFASFAGDEISLSEADLQVLGLALELKTHGYSPLIATDDYSIQNVADQMDIEFVSMATLGIRFRFHWIRYCPACYKRYPANHESRKCIVCGTELKRKPLKKRLVKQ